MSNRVNYCKRLLKKAFIIESNLGKNEKESVSNYLDELGEKFDNDSFLVDDKNPCKCTQRSDVLLMNDKNYCVDCLCYIKDSKKKRKEYESQGKKEKSKRPE